MFKGLDTVNWTKLSHDVFRAPSMAIVLSTLIGLGTQCIAISVTMIVLFTLGNFGREARDFFHLAFFVVSALYGIIAGYVSSRLYKFFNGTWWLSSFYLTAGVVPICIAIGLVAVDILDWFERHDLSTRYGMEKAAKSLGITDKIYDEPSMPISEVTLLFSIWLVIHIPSVAFGSYYGYRAEKLAVPVRTSRIEREIPTIGNIPCHAQACFTLLVGSLITSLCVVSEMYYIVTSIWRKYYFVVYGYLAIALLIMGFVAAQVS